VLCSVPIERARGKERTTFISTGFPERGRRGDFGLLLLEGKILTLPESPNYVPSIFGCKPGARDICHQRRYEALRCRPKK